MIAQHTEHIDIFSPEKTIIDRYLFAIKAISNKVVLDFGCGNGHGCALFSAYGANKVIGYDINKKLIKDNQEKYKFNKNLKFIDDLSELKDNSIDVVTSFEVIEHIQPAELDEIMQLLLKVTKKDASFIISTPIENKDNIDEFHINEMNKEVFTKFLNKYFKSFYLYSTIEHIDGIWTNTKIINGLSELSRCFLVYAKK